ncbi:MAG: hypothetical protein ABFD18_00840 [Syntrophomonas sp.]
MSNQMIMWGSLIVPWLTLAFMNKEDIKRFMPAGLFATFLTIIFCDVGVRNGWWQFRATPYPFALLSPYVYGLFPIIPMWILKFTYERFWLFMGTESVVNVIFSFVLLPWFGSRGILEFNAGLIVFVVATLFALLMYGFQMWQESSV